MYWTKHHAIISALLYASIFDYPLTLSEVQKWAVSKDGKPWNITRNDLKGLNSDHGYFTLSNVKKIAKRRIAVELISLKKQQIARLAVRFLRYIPSVVFVGISGGVAAGNAQTEDDVDLFIICESGTIWITRILVLLLLELLGKRRRAKTIHEEDLLCPNMFLSRKQLTIKPSSLYLAHEILQCIPLFERANIYNEFLLANKWVKNYFPLVYLENTGRLKQWEIAPEHPNICAIFRLIDPICGMIERKIMASKQTTEIISSRELKFHPQDMSIHVKEKLTFFFRKYHIPLDKAFF